MCDNNVDASRAIVLGAVLFFRQLSVVPKLRMQTAKHFQKILWN